MSISFARSPFYRIIDETRFPGQWISEKVIDCPPAFLTRSYSLFASIFYDANPSFSPVGQNREGYGRRVKLPWVLTIDMDKNGTTEGGYRTYRIFAHATPEGNRYYVVDKTPQGERRVFLDVELI